MESSEGLITVNYSDIFFSYYFSKESKCNRMIRDHYLIYIFSGEYHIEYKGKRTVIKPGQCVFLKRDVRLNTYKVIKGEEPFRGIFMTFKRSFLQSFFKNLPQESIPLDTEPFKDSVVKMPASADVVALFKSMTAYLDASVKPSEEMMKLKLMEGVYSLLNINKKFFPTLFDFTEPWKIDLLGFMEQNYMYDLSLEEIASFTGRSLSTFKRDFKKISSLSPQKWIINRRLQAAHDMIEQNENRKIKDIYTDVGFKNESHFYYAYKKHFGTSPAK